MRAHTDPKLEAAIDASPDDVDGYAIYGDWLQTAGDPRGELVALQLALERDPANKKLAQRAAKYLREHVEALLGELAELDAKTFEVVWSRGFLRDIRIEHLPAPKLFEVLQTLLAHPAARFIRSLRITNVRAVAREAIVKFLVAQARPALLTDLRLDTELSDDELAELRVAFPRLGRSLHVEWQAIVQMIGEHRRTDLKYKPAKLPPLAPIDRAPDGIDATTILYGLRLEIDKREPIRIVETLKRTYTAASLDRFAVALGQQFFEVEGTSTRWGFLAVGPLGGPDAIRWIVSNLGRWSHGRFTQGIDLLCEIGTGAALFAIAMVVADPEYLLSRRDAAEVALGGVASARGLSIDQLIDRGIPAVLDDDQRVAVVRRMRDVMLAGRRFDATALRTTIVGHPEVGPLAERVVWATYDRDDVERTFRLTGGRAIDLDGAAVELDGARIGIVHPAELEPGERAALLGGWREAFEALGIEPLFEQLDRPVHVLSTQEASSDALARWKLRSVGFDRLKEVLEGRDWRPHLLEREWGTDAWSVTFARDPRVRIQAEHDKGTIKQVTLHRPWRSNAGDAPTSFAKLHPVTISEMIDDLDTATTRPTASPEAIAAAAGSVVKGARVKIKSGTDKGAEGVVFWLGERGGEIRCGLRTDDGATLWADVDAVKVIASKTPKPEKPEKPEKPAKPDKKTPPKEAADDGALPPGVAKGARVHWKRGSLSGTGTLFWLGKNKFGDGMRAGVKDDETKDTVWVDAADCKPTT